MPKCPGCHEIVSKLTAVEYGEACDECLAEYYCRCQKCGKYVDHTDHWYRSFLCLDCALVAKAEREERWKKEEL